MTIIAKNLWFEKYQSTKSKLCLQCKHKVERHINECKKKGCLCQLLKEESDKKTVQARNDAQTKKLDKSEKSPNSRGRRPYKQKRDLVIHG